MSWQEAYDDACQRFGGQRPGNALEQELIEAYEARPVAFQHAVDKLAQRYADGKVRSPWPLVKAELEQDDQGGLTAGCQDRRQRCGEFWLRGGGAQKVRLVDAGRPPGHPGHADGLPPRPRRSDSEGSDEGGQQRADHRSSCKAHAHGADCCSGWSPWQVEPGPMGLPIPWR